MLDARTIKPSLDALAQAGIFMGTSSWKYPGWMGQLYTAERYTYRGKVSKSRFEKHCLEEYSGIFPSVCVDASFYRFPGENYLQHLAGQAPSGFRFSHKVTDTITIKHFPRHARHGEFAGKNNPCYLNADIFLQSFLRPLQPYREKTGLIIFEFGRFYPRDYQYGRDFVRDLDAFLGKLPAGEWDFGIEIRNSSFLTNTYFETLSRHRVGHVYNQWHRMPSIARQLRLHIPDRSAAPVGCRLLLKNGRDYATAVEAFEPYDRIQEEQLEVRAASANLIRLLREKPEGRRSYIYVNNRLEGNALATINAILALVGTGSPDRR